MANRATPAIQQETLSPPWLLASFDSNWNSPITALNDASMGYVNGVPIDSGSANNVIVTLPFGVPGSYNSGMTVVFYPAASNTGPTVITVNPLTSVSILNQFGQSLSPNDLVGTQSQSGTMNGTQLVSGLTSTAGLVAGQLVSGANIAAGTTIYQIASPTSILLSQNASGSGTNSITFAAVIATVIFDGSHFILLSPTGSNVPIPRVSNLNVNPETVSRVFDTMGSPIVVLSITVTAAINYSLTLNNVAAGAIISLRLANQSGAGRVFTVLANSPAGVAYPVALTGTQPFFNMSIGQAIANFAVWNGIGIVAAVTSPLLLLVGGVGG